VPSQLARQWFEEYPGLFDEDDLRLNGTQGHEKYHFYEWYVAVHLFQRDGAVSMVEKYDSPTHRRKFARYQELLAGLSEPQRGVLSAIRADHVQLPDLLVLARDGESFSFAEVKGQGDRLLPRQIASHEVIRQELNVRVEVVKVMLTDLEPTGASH
jgi:hypothetical protein